MYERVQNYLYTLRNNNTYQDKKMFVLETKGHNLFIQSEIQVVSVQAEPRFVFSITTMKIFQQHLRWTGLALYEM